MPKKRIILIGILLVFCLAGQWLLRTSQVTNGSSEKARIRALQASDSIFQDNSLPESDKPAENRNMDNLHQQLVRQLIIMIVFVALIGTAVWWFARRYSHGLLGGKGKLVTVTETVPLGPRKMVHILQVGSRKLLLGSTADSIRFLADITDSVEIPSSTDESERGQIG